MKPVLILAILPGLLAAQVTVSLSASPNPSVFGAAVTLTANLTPADATGRVTFYDGANLLGIAPLVGGRAILTTSLLATGARSLRAHYSGSSSYLPSNSAPLPQTVNSVAAGGFQAAVNYPANTYTEGVAVADFNADGKMDLAVFDYSDITILLGNGDGTFQPGFSYRYGGYVESAAVGDFNGDGKADLAVVDPVDGLVSVFLGNGDGTFRPPVSYSAGQNPASAIIADFNGDGNADLAVVDPTGGAVSVLLGSGDGTFQPAAVYPVGVGAQFMAIGASTETVRRTLQLPGITAPWMYC